MPVDKFGHTDVGVSQRVVTGGLTISQVNANYLRIDGSNAAKGTLNMNNNKIIGLPTSTDETPTEDEAVSRHQVISLIKNWEDEPENDKHLTNKKYVDAMMLSVPTKCSVGYIPSLGANTNYSGFMVSASSSITGNEPYKAFRNTNDGWSTNTRENACWLQIKCPEPVKIWRIAIVISPPNLAWSLSGSNNGSEFTSLFSHTSPFATMFYNISTTTAYEYYRITIPILVRDIRKVFMMQLYTYNA